MPKFTHMNLFWNDDVYTSLIHSIHATLSESDVTDKTNSWFADITFDWRHVMVTFPPLILQGFNQIFTNNEQKNIKTKRKDKKWLSFFWGSTKYEHNGSPAKCTWRPSGTTYFARDPLCSYFVEPQKNEIYFLNMCRYQQCGIKRSPVGTVWGVGCGGCCFHERKNNWGKRDVNVTLPCDMTSEKHKPFIYQILFYRGLPN